MECGDSDAWKADLLMVRMTTARLTWPWGSIMQSSLLGEYVPDLTAGLREPGIDILNIDVLESCMPLKSWEHGCPRLCSSSHIKPKDCADSVTGSGCQR